jgi:hypothetical protein
MKCPKCSFISFDFNQSCPKCKKDLSEVKAKMNLPSFRPVVFDLPSFAGQLSESRAGTHDQRSKLDMEETMEVKFSDRVTPKSRHDSALTQRIDESEIDFSLEDESDDMTLDFDEPSITDSIPASAKKKEIIAAKDSIEAGLDLAFEDETDGLSLDMDGLSFDDSETNVPEVEAETTRGKSVEERLDLSFDEEDDSSGDNEPILNASEPKAAEIEATVSVDSIEKDLELSFEDVEDDMDVGSDDFVIDSSEDETTPIAKADGEIDFEFDIKDPDQDKAVAFDVAKEESSSLDLESMSVEEIDSDIDLKFAEQEGQLAFDLEESASKIKEEKNQYASPPLIRTRHNNEFSSELEVLDLDLDLDKPDN